MLNKALYFIIGAAVGAAASYFITAKVVGDKEKARADAEIEEMKAYYDKKYKVVSDKADEVAKRNEERKEELLNERQSEHEPRPERHEYYNPTHEEFVENLKVIEAAGYTRYGMIHPYHVITDEEYDDPKYEDYTKSIQYTYFKGDGTVLDELGEEITDEHEIEESVGIEFMAYLRDHPDVYEVYVRNDDRRIDYTISVEDGYYETTIDPNAADELEGEE